MSQFITLQQAVDMTTLYRQDKETILSSSYKNQNILAQCETFDRAVFDTLLAQSGCSFIRIYYGMDTSNKVHAIVVAADANEEDILSSSSPGRPNATYIGEEAKRCPDDCPPPSDLNS